VVLAVVGLAAQFVDGALGMAYGVTSTTLLLTGGIAPVVASASVHLAEVGSTLASGVAHWRFGNIDRRTVALLTAPGAIGAFLGAVALSSVSAEVAAPLVAGFLFCLGAYILLRFARAPVMRERGRRRLPWFFLSPLGLFAGFMDAAGGGGWGPIGTPTLLSSGRLEPRKVVGSVDAAEFLVAIGASAGFLAALGAHSLDYTWVAALLAGGVVAAPLAAWLVRRLPPQMLGAAVGGIILLTNARTLGEALDVDGAPLLSIYAVIVLAWGAALTLAAVRIRRERAGAPA
jgi:uncharacterized protein